MAVCSSKAWTASPFQLCHYLVPSDKSGSEVYPIHQSGWTGHLVPGTVVLSLNKTLASLLHRAAYVLIHDVGAPVLVPSTGPRVVPRLRARVAQSRAAQGQQGQQGRRPAAGCSGSGRGLLTHLEPHKAAVCGAAGTGSGLGCLAAPLAPCPHASALAAPRSLNDAQVPPGAALFISLPSPKRDSSLHHLSALCLSAGGSGGKSQRVRNRGLGYRFSNYTFLWSLPKRQQLRLSPSKQRAPSPSGSAESVGRSPPRSPGPLSGKEPRTTPSVSSSGGTHAGGLSFNSFL